VPICDFSALIRFVVWFFMEHSLITDVTLDNTDRVQGNRVQLNLNVAISAFEIPIDISTDSLCFVRLAHQLYKVALLHVENPGGSESLILTGQFSLPFLLGWSWIVFRGELSQKEQSQNYWNNDFRALEFPGCVIRNVISGLWGLAEHLWFWRFRGWGFRHQHFPTMFA
jgi:hypothetical protein